MTPTEAQRRPVSRLRTARDDHRRRARPGRRPPARTGGRRAPSDPCRRGGPGRPRAAWLQAGRVDGPFHVALMLDNVPEFVFWLEAAALAGAVVVGGNPTHRGRRAGAGPHPHRVPVPGHRLRPTCPWSTGTRHRRRPRRPSRHDNPAVLVLDTAGGADGSSARRGAAGRRRRPTPPVTPETLGYLLFTSGTSGAPKACLCSQGRLARIGAIVAQMYDAHRPTTSATCPCRSSTPTR